MHCLPLSIIGTDSAATKVLFVHIDKLAFRGPRASVFHISTKYKTLIRARPNLASSMSTSQNLRLRHESHGHETVLTAATQYSGASVALGDALQRDRLASNTG